MVEKVSKMFSPSHLMGVARSTGFVKNKSKLRPHMFLDFLLFRQPDDTRGSLGSFVCALRSRFDKTFRRQSLHQRFTPQAVDFVKQLVGEQLERQITMPIKSGLTHFNSIKIKDSTRFQIPEHLKEAYPGSGGGASEAGIHIQLEYDLLSGKIEDFNLTDAKRQDSTDASETVSLIQKGDLIIRDLGYFVQGVFNKIIEAEAYFLTRVKPKTALYDGKGRQIDLVALHKRMKRNKIERMEIQVTTNQIKHPIRLIVEMLPSQVVEKRIEKARKEAKKKGRQLSDSYRSYAALNLFITNVEQEKLSVGSAIGLYRVRWQIELRFKAWKSLCQLHKVKKMNKHRFECHLFSKLLFILICWELGYHFQAICYRATGKLISLYQFYRMICDDVSGLRANFHAAPGQMKDYLIKAYRTSRESLLQYKRKYRVNLHDLIGLIVDNQHINNYI